MYSLTSSILKKKKKKDVILFSLIVAPLAFWIFYMEIFFIMLWNFMENKSWHWDFLLIQSFYHEMYNHPLHNFNCCCLVTKLCPSLLQSHDCSLPGTSFHEISQAAILEWVAISFSMRSSWPRDWTRMSYMGRWILYHWATKQAHNFNYCSWFMSTLQLHASFDLYLLSALKLCTPYQKFVFFLWGTIHI